MYFTVEVFLKWKLLAFKIFLKAVILTFASNPWLWIAFRLSGLKPSQSNHNDQSVELPKARENTGVEVRDWF